MFLVFVHLVKYTQLHCCILPLFCWNMRQQILILMTLIMKYLCWLTHVFCIYIELILDFNDSAYVVFNFTDLCCWTNLIVMIFVVCCLILFISTLLMNKIIQRNYSIFFWFFCTYSALVSKWHWHYRINHDCFMR